MKDRELQQHFIQSCESIFDHSEAVGMYRIIQAYWQDHAQEGTLMGKPFSSWLQEIQKRIILEEPLQYILQEAWFYDIPFYVDPRVLIPRPETEELVNWIIKEHSKTFHLKILDVGTGSGCIPIILKRKIPQATVISCDVEIPALEVAKINAQTYQVAIEFLAFDFLDPQQWAALPRVDIMVSNPPYIPVTEKMTMPTNVVAHEPPSALFVPDSDPLVFYKAILQASQQILKPQGCIYLEIHEDLAQPVMELFNQDGFEMTLRKDLQGKNRMVKCCNKA